MMKDRRNIKALLEAGHSQTKIAAIIGVHRSTISRELSGIVLPRGRNAKCQRVSPGGSSVNNQPASSHEVQAHRFTKDLNQDAI